MLRLLIRIGQLQLAVVVAYGICATRVPCTWERKPTSHERADRRAAGLDSLEPWIPCEGRAGPLDLYAFGLTDESITRDLEIDWSAFWREFAVALAVLLVVTEIALRWARRRSFRSERSGT